MSTGTNKERIEQNNTLLEDIKTQIQNLPEAGGTVEGIKQFSTVDEMQADTTAQEGDLAVVYRSEVQNIKDGDIITSITFPKTVVFDTAITSDYYSMLQNSIEPRIYLDMNLSSTSFTIMDTYDTIPEITYTSSDGITYTRTDANANTYEIGETTISDIDEHICKFIQIGGSTFDGLYEYSDSNWVLVPTQLTATSDYVYEKEFYGKNGVESGTLGAPDNSFADTSAEIVYKIQNAYNNMEPRVLTADDKTIDKNIYFIPVKKDGTVLLDTSSVTSMFYMFAGCTNLTEIPLLDTSSVTSMSYMFYKCTNLTTISLLDTSSVTSMQEMFYGCTNLTEIPLLNTSKVTDMSDMFQDCTNLTTIPLLDTSSVTRMGLMFYKCTSLATIPLLDTSSVTIMQEMFYGCNSLSDESLNNILAMCANATSYTSTKTLKYVGLKSAQATKCKSLSNYSVFTAAGWTTGY